jgi:hypothetical protein
MPLGDVSYVNAALDALVASWPSSGAHYHLFVSDPAPETTALTVELTSGGGYAAVTFSPSDWASASGGSITTTAPVSWGTSTAAYDDIATYWGIVDGSGLLVFSDSLDTPVEVDGASVAVARTPTISFADGS